MRDPQIRIRSNKKRTYRGVNKGRLPAFAGGNVLLAGGKISDRPVEISILANILLRLQFHLIYLAIILLF